MAQVKGIAILGLVKFTKKRLKGTHIDEFLRLLDDDADRQIFQRKILATEWYPYRTFINLLTLIDKQFGRGDLSFAREQGRMSADADLTGVLKAFLRIGPTRFSVRRAMNVWGSYYDAGRIDIHETGGKAWQMRVTEFPEVKKIHCKNIEGWLERYLELCGEKGVRVRETQCRTEGAPFCQFDVEFASS